VPATDPSISWYKEVDGTRFYERMQIPFTMSSLDTPVYWHYLESLKPDSAEKLIVDIGGGDGRNTEPWLAWGYKRVVATDAVFSSLARFHSRLRAEHPEWLERVLLVECDQPIDDVVAVRLPRPDVASLVDSALDRSGFWITLKFQQQLESPLRLFTLHGRHDKRLIGAIQPAGMT
jgi:hypothetical protein